eukprot:784518-Pleurochrysis_carterae.AAC.1
MGGVDGQQYPRPNGTATCKYPILVHMLRAVTAQRLRARISQACSHALTPKFDRPPLSLVPTRTYAPVSASFITRRDCISNCLGSRDVRGQARWQHEDYHRHPGAPDGTSGSWREAQGVEQCRALERRGRAQVAGCAG